METARLQQDDNGGCFRHVDVSCRHLSVLQTEVIWKVLLVWHTYLSWIDSVCALGWLQSGGASWPHLDTRIVWPPQQVLCSSRLSCDSPRPHPPSPLCIWARDKEKVRGEKTPSGSYYSSDDRRGYQMRCRFFGVFVQKKIDVFYE